MGVSTTQARQKRPLEPPGPAGLPLLGNIPRFGGDQNILFHFIDAWEEFGECCHLRLGPFHVYVVAEPENVHHVLVRNSANYIKGSGYTGFRLLVGNGLVTSDGDLWRSQRKLMQPSFTPAAIEGFAHMMVRTIDVMLDRWLEVAQTGAVLHMDDEMARLTMSIISQTIFGIDLGRGDSAVSRAFQDAFAFVTARTMSALPLPMSWPLPAHRRFRRSRALIDDFVRRQIASGQTDEETVLAILLRARDEETGKPMRREQLRDEVVTLFLAGFETTARTLTWGWYLLDQYSHEADKLAAEASAVYAGRAPSLDDARQLHFTRSVVDEVLRLYPPTALLGRQIVADDVIGGYRVRGNGIVMLAPLLTHRLPSVWADPETFEPKRFAPGAARPPRGAYVPFISGPRICLGNHFALLEMTLLFSMAAARFRLVRTERAPIGYGFHGSTCPTAPLMMRPVVRK